jgi:phytanoyl-CoA hydroxylase
MSESLLSGLVSKEELQQFTQQGYLVIRGLLSKNEVDHISETFSTLHSNGPIPGCFHPVPPEKANGDILKLYPRMMHPHRVNDIARDYMLHPRVMGVLNDLFGEEPLAGQSMFYFKPPGGKGQALHQDNYYLKVEPNTCIAAWMAIDPADRENGGMVVVPKSNRLDIQCPHVADPELSFTRDEVDVPEGFEVLQVDLAAGDVLFFNGSVIHGSYPNKSDSRFRRSFIGHYVGSSTLRLGHFYNPLYTHDGRIVKREDNMDSGPCGEEFSESQGQPH